MNCFMCKGGIEDKNTTFMVDVDGKIIVIKNVPSQVCRQCGEVSYSNPVAKELEKLVNSMRASKTEVVIMSYSQEVA